MIHDSQYLRIDSALKASSVGEERSIATRTLCRAELRGEGREDYTPPPLLSSLLFLFSFSFSCPKLEGREGNLPGNELGGRSQGLPNVATWMLYKYCTMLFVYYRVMSSKSGGNCFLLHGIVNLILKLSNDPAPPHQARLPVPSRSH